MSEESDFATFKKAPLEAYKTLFEKFLKAKGDNEKVRGRYHELAVELDKTREKLEALHAKAGENSVLEDSNPEAEISILNDNMAAQEAQPSASKAPVICGNSEPESVFLWVTKLKKLQSVNKWTDQQTLDASTMALILGDANERVCVTQALVDIFGQVFFITALVFVTDVPPLRVLDDAYHD